MTGTVQPPPARLPGDGWHDIGGPRGGGIDYRHGQTENGRNRKCNGTEASRDHRGALRMDWSGDEPAVRRWTRMRSRCL
jgi:hypothetical protein